MNSKKSQEDCIKSSTTALDQKSISKWLLDMSSSFEKNTIIKPTYPELCFRGRKNDLNVISSDIPSRLSDTIIQDLGVTRKDVSEKYSKRSIVTQMYFKNTPRNISLTSADYLVPKFEHIDFNELKSKDLHQTALENSYKNLDSYKRSHNKGTTKDIILNQYFGEKF